MPRGAKLINVARGAVIDEAALMEALAAAGSPKRRSMRSRSSRCRPAHPFWSMENVLITPHLASITVPEDAARDVAESIRRVR